jgi:hypothetical protein
MNALSIFLGEFWSPFIGVTIGLSVVWLARRSSSDWYPPFIGPKSFTELSGFAKDQQKQLLHEASSEAFAGWRYFVSVVMFAAMFAAGAALGRTLPKVTTVPDSLWVHAGFAALFAAFGGWLAGRLHVRHLRPFLKASIERTQHAA